MLFGRFSVLACNMLMLIVMVDIIPLPKGELDITLQDQ